MPLPKVMRLMRSLVVLDKVVNLVRGLKMVEIRSFKMS